MQSTNWDYSVFWKEAVKHIRASLSEQEFEMWFKNVRLDESSKEEISLAVPSSFYRDQLKQRYMDLIQNTLYDLSGHHIHIKFVVKKQQPPSEEDTKKGAAASAEQSAAVQSDSGNGSRKKPKISVDSPEKSHPDLRPDYTFDNFVIGDNNSLAANASIAIARNPGSSYNPCLIYGGVGLGKTHLIQSVGNHVFHEFDNARIVYVTAETFTNEFIQAIHDRKNHQFKNKYRNVDVLLIDDVHFLQSKDQTQEELFHTFNALYDANKQMVFTCDRPVSELKNLTDRLRSRFERGLNVDLQPPNFETRFAILKRKVTEKGLPIDDEVIELICKNINTNVRDLEAALTKLSAYADLLGKRITTDIAKEQLKDVFSNPKQSNINIEMIQRVVADYFNLSAYDLRGKKRTKAIAFPRQIAMYITREITEFSTTEVGLEFGGRDHTTVMHACQRIESRMQTDPFLEPMIQGLIRNIKEYGTKS
jgi:chromosomal replication initiator protein